MSWFQIILVIRKIVKIIIDSGILDGMETGDMEKVTAFADADPALMKSVGFAEIMEIIQLLMPVLQQIWEIIQRDDGITQ